MEVERNCVWLLSSVIMKWGEVKNICEVSNECFKETESAVWSFRAWGSEFTKQMWEDYWAQLSAHLRSVVIILKEDVPWLEGSKHFHEYIATRSFFLDTFKEKGRIGLMGEWEILQGN